MSIDEAQADPLEKTVYAVWIRGKGWLKHSEDGQTTFCSTNRAVANTAALLWGQDAQVLPFDQSLLDLESKFLTREKELPQLYRLRAWLKRHGILG